MAAPDLTSLTTVTGKVAGVAIGATATDLVANASASGKLVRIVSVYIANVDGTNDATVNVDVQKNAGTAYRITNTVNVPADTTLVVISKDAPVYLEENDKLRATASAASDLEAVVSYEELS